jgi:pimeloyl-ACP methyl ester carboxylesterase
MTTLSPGDATPVQLTPRMTLQPAGKWLGDAHLAAPGADVLSAESASTTSFELFSPAEPAVILNAQPVPAPAAVLGAEDQTGIEYQPDPDFAYVLLQEIETPDGIIYDFTLPKPMPNQPIPGVLGAPSSTGSLWFPLNPVIDGDEPSAPGGVLGVGDAISNLGGSIVIRRVVQMLKSPIQQSLLTALRQSEPQPQVVRLSGGDSEEAFVPLEGFESWRSLLPPGDERRVLLFIHGFGSSMSATKVSQLLPGIADRYDAVLGYNHPTITVDPLENARALLAMIPEDLRLSVDLVAHSRGGLVARSLVELADPVPQFTPRRLLTNGSPHGGTQLADPERWDKLISIGMTAASWLATTTGVALWIPKLLEFVLKAGAQGVFALSGIAAMTPKGEFITKLNGTNQSGVAEKVRYSTVASNFSPFNVKQNGFRQSFKSLAANAFMNEPNDLVVPTSSMNAIDLPFNPVPPERALRLNVDHFSYFNEERVKAFLQEQLAQD